MKPFPGFLAGCLIALAALAAPAHAATESDTLRRVVVLPALEVSTTRLDPHAPLAHSRLDRADIRRANWGQDTPMLLASLPGAFAYSDAGNGIGYSYLSLRGFPQRRISVAVNGVPLNDPESHEVWWIDHPDLLASASEVQVQRGVGSALYGAAALGGSISIETGALESHPRFSTSVSSGSFGTRRFSVEGATGTLPNDWNLSGRYSRIETDGYRDQSWSRLWSYALSARRQSLTQLWSLNLYGGPENTHLAYLGISPDRLAGRVTGSADADRRYNPISYAGEQDHFFEPHYELVHTWGVDANLTFSQTLFWFDGRGFYDERRTGRSLADYRLTPWASRDTTLLPHDYYALDSLGNVALDGQGRATVTRTDLVRRREVTNRHFGWVPRLRLSHSGGTLTLGGEVRQSDGHHVGSVVSGSALPPGTAPDAEYYNYHPRILSTGVFLREEWNVRPTLAVTADLAWRHQGYAMRDDRFDGIRFDQPYDFALPRLGAAWTPDERWSAFASYGIADREPAFRDLYDAEGAGSLPLYRHVDVAAGIYEDPLVRPERARDAELGLAWHDGTAHWSVNAYRMDFADELVWAGQFNTDLGYPILGNAARSVHQGLELAGGVVRPVGVLRGELGGNVSLGDHRFVRYVEHYGPTSADDVSYAGQPIAGAPARLANLSARLGAHGVTANADVRYAGRLHVDNTGSEAHSIAPHTTLDLGLAASRVVAGAATEISLRLFNATDARYATSGYMDYDEAGAYVPMVVPAATRSWLFGLRVEW